MHSFTKCKTASTWMRRVSWSRPELGLEHVWKGVELFLDSSRNTSVQKQPLISERETKQRQQRPRAYIYNWSNKSLQTVRDKQTGASWKYMQYFLRVVCVTPGFISFFIFIYTACLSAFWTEEAPKKRSWNFKGRTAIAEELDQSDGNYCSYFLY